MDLRHQYLRMCLEVVEHPGKEIHRDFDELEGLVHPWL
jgi:hypothetical protein